MTAKTTVTHDRLSVKVALNKATYINLGFSRYRDSCSAKGVDRNTMSAVFKAFSNLRDHSDYGTIGEKIELTAKLARESADMTEFSQRLWNTASPARVTA